MFVSCWKVCSVSLKSCNSLSEIVHILKDGAWTGSIGGYDFILKENAASMETTVQGPQLLPVCIKLL